MRTFVEHAALIGADPPLVSVVTRPPPEYPTVRGTGVVLLGAGLVHHVGPNRLMVRAARRLAALGHVVVRFDHRGIGDSSPRRDNQPFAASAVEETRDVMDHLCRHHSVDSFVLMGICSGAETALRTACSDRRVVGTVLINGGGQGIGMAWDTYEFIRRESRYYLTHSLFRLDSWRRALTGRIQYRRLLVVIARQLWNRLSPPKEVITSSREVAGDVEALIARGVRVLWVQSQGDFSQDYFDTMFGKNAKHLIATGGVRLEVIPFADHTLTGHQVQLHFLENLKDWLAPEKPDEARAPTPRQRQASS